MSKPILKDENINLKNLVFFVIDVLKKYFKTFIFTAFIFTVYFFFLKTPAYSSKVSFYTNYNESSQSGALSFIRSFTGDKFSQRLYLGFSVSEYLASDKFLEDIVVKEYEIDGNSLSLVDYWGVAYNDIFSLNPIGSFKRFNRKINLNKNLSIDDQKLLLTKEVLKESIIHIEDPITSLHEVSVTVRKNQDLSKQIVSNMYNSIVKYSNDITNIKAREKKDFISDRLNKTKENLDNAENQLLVFLEGNKNSANSPNLKLQTDRLSRDIDLYDQLYITLSDQLEIAKINEKDNTSTVFLLDSPYLIPYKAGKEFLESIISLFILLFTLLLFKEGYSQRKQLFLSEEQNK